MDECQFLSAFYLFFYIKDLDYSADMRNFIEAFIQRNKKL